MKPKSRIERVRRRIRRKRVETPRKKRKDYRPGEMCPKLSGRIHNVDRLNQHQFDEHRLSSLWESNP